MNCLRSDINQLLKLCVTPLMVVLIFFQSVHFFVILLLGVVKHGQDWSIKGRFSCEMLRSGRNSCGFSRGGNVLIGSGLFFCRGIHDKE